MGVAGNFWATASKFSKIVNFLKVLRSYHYHILLTLMVSSSPSYSSPWFVCSDTHKIVCPFDAKISKYLKNIVLPLSDGSFSKASLHPRRLLSVTFEVTYWKSCKVPFSAAIWSGETNLNKQQLLKNSSIARSSCFLTSTGIFWSTSLHDSSILLTLKGIEGLRIYPKRLWLLAAVAATAKIRSNGTATK